MPQRVLTEGEKEHARELASELAEKTRESLINPQDEFLDQRIGEIRKELREMGFEIACSRRATIDQKTSNVEYDVEVTLYLPLAVQ